MNVMANTETPTRSPEDIHSIRKLIDDHPSWSRRQISQELATLWNWRAANGTLRDMACRTYLLKLHRRNFICLPSPRKTANNDYRRWNIPDIVHTTDPIHAPLADLQPLQILPVRDHRQQRQLIKCLIHRYHYLGYRGSPGETLAYLVYDRQQRLLACLLFGAAAWSLKPRDQFIGWNADVRKQNLSFIVNHQRFLILPWVQSYNLASHILGQIAHRIGADYQHYFAHPVYLLETFVHPQKFRGTCYQAANWIDLGPTTGRTRNDRYTTIHQPVKDIYVYPLTRQFQPLLAFNHSSALPASSP